MAIEHEIKLLGINVDHIKSFLDKQNIKLEKKLNFKRVVFDTVPADKNAWIRLRDDGNETTLTYKNSKADSIDGMQEVEVITQDFDNTKEILTLAGFTPRNYQENNREVFHAFGCMITIDYWPLIPPYVEIEANSKEIVEACVVQFKGLYESTTSKATEAVYELYGIDLKTIDHLDFNTSI